MQGVRPVLSGSAYLLASASRPGALVHRLNRQGGIMVYSCEAGANGALCWHHMLINVIERAAELESLTEQAAAQHLSRQISETRASNAQRGLATPRRTVAGAGEQTAPAAPYR